MPSHVNPDKCTGCGTCEEVCPSKAISMDKNDKPVVNDTVCTDCGICVIDCPSEARELVEILRA